jgi:hypothetical protein
MRAYLKPEGEKMTRTIAALALLAGSAAASAQLTLVATQDTYVESAAPQTNFGQSAEIAAGKGHFWALGFARLFVRFDLSAITSGAEVGSATLRVYQHRTEPAAGGLSNDVYALASPWDEMTVTWDTAPGRGAAAGSPSMDVGSSFALGWIEFDVTDLVRAIADGAPNNGFMIGLETELLAGASRYGYFHSREYTGDPLLRPQLVIEEAGCYADCDESGGLDFFDFLCFQNSFAAGEAYADCDGSGSRDFFDFLCFQDEFAAGCP